MKKIYNAPVALVYNAKPAKMIAESPTIQMVNSEETKAGSYACTREENDMSTTTGENGSLWNDQW